MTYNHYNIILSLQQYFYKNRLITCILIVINNNLLTPMYLSNHNI